MHPCYLSKLERKGRLFEKDADLKFWLVGGGGGRGGAYAGEDAFLENGRLFEEILYIETLH